MKTLWKTVETSRKTGLQFVRSSETIKNTQFRVNCRVSMVLIGWPHVPLGSSPSHCRAAGPQAPGPRAGLVHATVWRRGGIQSSCFNTAQIDSSIPRTRGPLASILATKGHDGSPIELPYDSAGHEGLSVPATWPLASLTPHTEISCPSRRMSPLLPKTPCPPASSSLTRVPCNALQRNRVQYTQA